MELTPAEREELDELAGELEAMELTPAEREELDELAGE